VPMIRMSVLYWSYFAIFGVLFPYAGRYFHAYGFNFEQIGWIMACVTGANLFAPFIIARLSDITGQRVILARISIVCLLFALFLLKPTMGIGYVMMMALLIGMALSMALPQFEAIAMQVLGEDKHKYGLIRMWGTLGFLSTVWITGAVLAQFGVDWFRYGLMALVAFLLVITFWIPKLAVVEDTVVHAKTSGLERLKIPVIVLVFVVMLLNQAALAPYNIFADLYWQQWGFSSGTIGTLLALAAIAEAALMAVIPILLKRGGYYPLVVISLILAISRWLIMALVPDNMALLVIAQVIHAFSFGAMHGTAIYLVAHLFAKRHQGMGQSLYVSIVAGGGLILGNLVSGYLWDDGSGAKGVFLLAATSCTLSLILVVLFLKPQQLKSHFLS
jgi:PPP family 3-phenylpropionic acid transporter